MLSLLKNKIMKKIKAILSHIKGSPVTSKKEQCNIHDVVRSGDYCKCGACGYEGYAYGIAHAKGVSHPFCQNCGVNSKLSVINK